MKKHTNPDDRNKDGDLIVRVYFKTNREYVFPARDISNARDIAARVTREGCWIINEDGTEEYFPITEIHKAKILRKDSTDQTKVEIDGDGNIVKLE